MPDLADGDGLWRAAVPLLLNLLQQVQQAHDVIVVHVAQDREIKAASLARDSLEDGPETLLIDPPWPAIDQNIPGRLCRGVFEDEAIPVPRLNDMQIEHGSSPLLNPG